MHDPSFVLFEIRRPVPRVRRLRKPCGREGVRLPFVRYGRWEAYFPGAVTVWHDEPGGADARTVCKPRVGSGLSLRALRWGWQHRRHLRLQVRLWQQLNRWLWSRCAGCGKPFLWGHSPVSGQWDGAGPRWRRPERDVFHHECWSLSRARAAADERLWMIGELVERQTLAGETPEDAQRRVLDAFSEPSWTKAWRVLRSLKQTEAASDAG